MPRKSLCVRALERVLLTYRHACRLFALGNIHGEMVKQTCCHELCGRCSCAMGCVAMLCGSSLLDAIVAWCVAMLCGHRQALTVVRDNQRILRKPTLIPLRRNVKVMVMIMNFFGHDHDHYKTYDRSDIKISHRRFSWQFLPNRIVRNTESV
jgi:hypothetical protein